MVRFFLLALLCLAQLSSATRWNNNGNQGSNWKEKCYAVKLGLPVSSSSHYKSAQFLSYRLDELGRCWSPKQTNSQQWVQVASHNKLKWLGVITQGRQDADQWVTSYTVSYSNDGVNWQQVDGGQVFQGNNNRNTKVEHQFKRPVQARAIRINPVNWKPSIAMRFDFVFDC